MLWSDGYFYIPAGGDDFTLALGIRRRFRYIHMAAHCMGAEQLFRTEGGIDISVEGVELKIFGVSR